MAELAMEFVAGTAERGAGRAVVGAACADPASLADVAGVTDVTDVTESSGVPASGGGTEVAELAEFAEKLVRIELGPGGGWAAEPRGAARVVSRFAAARAAALAVPAERPGEVPAALAEAAARYGVVLLTVSAGTSWLRIAQVIGEERLRETREQLADLEQLLTLVREQGPPDSRAERLVGWLARTVGGAVTLTGTRSNPEPVAAPAGAPQLLAGARRTAEEVAQGRLASASIDDGGLRIRLTAIGRQRPFPVLAVGRTAPFDARSRALIAHTAELLAPILRLREAGADRDRLDEVAAALRVAVFQLLMGGEVTLAQRTAEGLSRGLLDAETARVYVLEGPAAERDRLAQECAAATEGQALVVRCPAYDQHLIIVAPLKDAGPAVPRRATAAAGPAPGPETGAPNRHGNRHENGWDAVGTTLRGFVARHPERCLGGSAALPLAQTAGSYGDAARALAVARLQPDRSALYAAESRLVQALAPDTAAVWAGGLLRPLHALSYASLDQMLGTLHLGLEFPATSAAKILGVSRNTVRARLDRAAGLLGLDLGGLRGRAVLHLALQACSVAGPDGLCRTSPSPDPQRPVRLVDVLSGAGARTWSEALLRRLAEDGRDLRGTLLTWLAADASVERTARQLDLHPQTVREHLRSAERLLQRQLLSGGGGVYETALAFAVLGELEFAEPAGLPDSPGPAEASPPA
ncbi:PucR family transcriptional regulator [Saccharothrix sp. ST-888]|uniref:PucR family transcriptional regulator n=1 Tax=Saccharothrix sp. ST-888 TaxID=1427391 RepID=UPI0012E08F46|nr:helix-turn-helix domain-containing protein [Saccharothrix sp. ST-888]